MGPANSEDIKLFLNLIFTTLITGFIIFGGLFYLNIRYDDPSEVFDKWIDEKLKKLWCFIRHK